jgi:hypothetical protein
MSPKGRDKGKSREPRMPRTGALVGQPWLELSSVGGTKAALGEPAVLPVHLTLKSVHVCA